MRGFLEIGIAILTGIMGQLLAKFFHLDEARKQTRLLEEQTEILRDIKRNLDPKG